MYVTTTTIYLVEQVKILSAKLASAVMAVSFSFCVCEHVLGCEFPPIPSEDRWSQIFGATELAESNLSQVGAVGQHLGNAATLNEMTLPAYERAVGMLSKVIQFWNPNITTNVDANRLVAKDMGEGDLISSVMYPLEIIAEQAMVLERPDVSAVAVVALGEINPEAAMELCQAFGLEQDVTAFGVAIAGKPSFQTIGATREFLLSVPPVPTSEAPLPGDFHDAMWSDGSAWNRASEAGTAKPDRLECRLTCHDEATNASIWEGVKETVKVSADQLSKLGQPDPADNNDVDGTPIEALMDGAKKASEKADEVYEQKYKACVEEKCPDKQTEPQVPAAPVDPPEETPVIQPRASVTPDQPQTVEPQEPLGEDPLAVSRPQDDPNAPSPSCDPNDPQCAPQQIDPGCFLEPPPPQCPMNLP